MERIRFANQLRGVAALCVACAHLVAIYWALPDVVSAVTATPPQTGTPPAIYWIVSFPWLNLGPFGVALFFLISGMVVPVSLDHHTRTSFLLARLLRIFPTYAAAILIEVAIISLCARAWDRPLPFTPAIVVANLTLSYDLLGLPSLDLVNWTLSVELKFYLLIALIAPAIRRASLPAVMLAAAAILAANLAMAAGAVGDLTLPPSSLSYTFSSHSLCLTYMLIGTLFNFHLRGKITTSQLCAAAAALAACTLAIWLIGVWRAQFPVVTLNYGYALILFAALYAVRENVPRNGVLDAMAAISFPFYLVHSLIGYIVLRTAMVGAGLPYLPSLALAFAAVVALATALHHAVERPTQRLGRRLARRQQPPARILAETFAP